MRCSFCGSGECCGGDYERFLSTLNKYLSNGYEVVNYFPDEYFLLQDKKLNMVRVYLEGGIWVKNENGEYVKEEAKR